MSVKTVLVSEVEGEGAVMSEGVVASSARGAGVRFDLLCGNLYWVRLRCIDGSMRDIHSWVGGVRARGHGRVRPGRIGYGGESARK